MKIIKVIFFLLLIGFVGFLSGCSSVEEKSSDSSSEEAKDSASFVDKQESSGMEITEEESAELSSELKVERMIIHRASIQTNVKELTKAQNNIEQKVKKYGGYIVESNVFQLDDHTNSGSMVVRIPEKHFETFLNDAEEEASKVLERNVTGQDVTEQYVDLSSRVKSKRVVERRLLAFMEKAEKTEDLLRISSDLAKVQEEIEVMVGKLTYLENQTSFSTIELTMYENRIIIPNIDDKELNTWEKTKKQFAVSTNVILAASSGMIVFFIGNLPILLILSVTAFLVLWYIKKKKRHKDTNE